jgi:phage terminase small subunit
MSRRSPSRDVDGLSLRERLFVKSYIANDGNGQRATADAGYSGDCAKRARDLLGRDRVWRKIQQSARAVLSPLEVRAERVLYETTHIAFADPRKRFHTDNSLLKPSLWPEEIAREI